MKSASAVRITSPAVAQRACLRGDCKLNSPRAGRLRSRPRPPAVMSHSSGLPPRRTPCGDVPRSAQLLSERGDIDDRPLFHDPPGGEAEESHSLDTYERAVARH